MPFYHGTHRWLLPLILKHGLGGLIVAKNYGDAENGVYLAEHPVYCVGVLLEAYSLFGRPESHPPTELAGMCVIVIDDSRIDRLKLRPDPEMRRPDIWIYDGVVDVTNQPIISVEDALRCCSED